MALGSIITHISEEQVRRLVAANRVGGIEVEALGRIANGTLTESEAQRFIIALCILNADLRTRLEWKKPNE